MTGDEILRIVGRIRDADTRTGHAMRRAVNQGDVQDLIDLRTALRLEIADLEAASREIDTVENRMLAEPVRPFPGREAAEAETALHRFVSPPLGLAPGPEERPRYLPPSLPPPETTAQREARIRNALWPAASTAKPPQSVELTRLHSRKTWPAGTRFPEQTRHDPYMSNEDEQRLDKEAKERRWKSGH